MKNRKLPTYRYVKVQQTNQWRSILATIDALPSFMESVGEMLTVGFAELLRQVDESLAPLFRALHEAFRPFVAPPLPEGVIPTRRPDFVIWDDPIRFHPQQSGSFALDFYTAMTEEAEVVDGRVFSREVCEQADEAQRQRSAFPVCPVCGSPMWNNGEPLLVSETPMACCSECPHRQPLPAPFLPAGWLAPVRRPPVHDDTLPAPVYPDTIPLPSSYWQAPVMIDSEGPGMLVEELLDESTLAFIKKRDG